MFSRQLLALITAHFWFLSSVFSSEPVKIPVSRDAWISAYPTEVEGNNGSAARLKLKGTQEFFLIDFDPSPFEGRMVEYAELWLHGEGDDPLFRVTVSTVQQDWVEGQGSGYDTTVDGCSFYWANRRAPWDETRTDVTAVTLGNGGSQWAFSDSTPRDADGWQSIPIDPTVLQRRWNDGCYGFLVMDDVGSEYQRDGNRFEYRLMPNRVVSSRESRRDFQPYFLVWFGDRSEVNTQETSPSIKTTELDSAASTAAGSGKRTKSI